MFKRNNSNSTISIPKAAEEEALSDSIYEAIITDSNTRQKKHKKKEGKNWRLKFLMNIDAKF